MDWGTIIGEARDHDELVALLRRRKDALQLSDKVVGKSPIWRPAM